MINQKKIAKEIENDSKTVTKKRGPIGPRSYLYTFS